jgi:hypothetical protein
LFDRNKRKFVATCGTSKTIKNILSVGQNHVRLERIFADAMRAAFSSDAAHSKAADRFRITSQSYLPRARHSQNKIQRRGTPAQVMCVDPNISKIHLLNPSADAERTSAVHISFESSARA